MSDEWPICDWFLDPLASTFEQFVDFQPLEARQHRLSRELFRDMLTNSEFERGLAGIASSQGQQISEALRARVVSFIDALRKWEAMKGVDEQEIQGFYWEELYDPADKLAAHLRNLSFIEQRKHTPDNEKATQIELGRRIHELNSLSSAVRAEIEKRDNEKKRGFLERCLAFAGRRLEQAVDLRAFAHDDKTRRLRRSNLVARDLFRQWMDQEFGKMLKAAGETDDAYLERLLKRFEQAVTRLIEILSSKLPAKGEVKSEEHGDFQPARWFTRNTDLTADTLNKAAKAKPPQIRSNKTPGSQRRYSVSDARRRWPHSFKLPQTRKNTP